MPRISMQNPMKPCVKTVLPINSETSRDVTVFCPGCKTLETLSLNGEVMAPSRRFTQSASEVYHACNKRFAELLGYKSPKEWADAEAPLADVVEEDQQGVIDAYMNASKRMVASSLEVRLKNIQTGNILKTRMITAPFGHAGPVFTVHFFDII